jgi:hypothetical protein
LTVIENSPGGDWNLSCEARIAFAASARMAAPLPLAVRIALWTSSIGLAVFLARRVFARRTEAIDVGRVSDDWLAQQRWPPSDPFTV